jgi:hypothetical protein
LGESRRAATALAPAPDGANAHADHEPVASCGAERRLNGYVLHCMRNRLMVEAKLEAQFRALPHVEAANVNDATSRQLFPTGHYTQNPPGRHFERNGDVTTVEANATCEKP